MRKVLHFPVVTDSVGVEYLDEMPDKVAEIFESYPQIPKMDLTLANLYLAIAKEQNYFQQNSPTAFGNPEYSRLQGIVAGFCMGAGLDYSEKDGVIQIRSKKGSLLMTIERPKRCEEYYKKLKEIDDILSQIL